MAKKIIFLVFVFSIQQIISQNVGINTTGAAGYVAAGLDVDFSNKGLLIPRIALTGPTDVVTVPSPTLSLLIFNTTNSAAIYPGFYYWTGSCWRNVNTPPIGSTFIQWFGASDPNVIYPCTTWISSDMQNGEFIRATGGNANVPSAGALTGVVQGFTTEDHTHSATITINNSAPLTTSSNGAHNHTGYTGGYNDIGTGCGSPKWIPYDDNNNADQVAAGSAAIPSASCPWNGMGVVGNFMGRTDTELNHNHSISTDGNHTHTVPAHNHTGTATVGNMASGTPGIETRPINVAVKFWRRLN
ncbi:MAG: hypothetical protein JSU07_14305 [Bacteroidetes bacterium]|nr:hypothetical protein [Bacteroidota bacterium]